MARGEKFAFVPVISSSRPTEASGVGGGVISPF